MIVFFIVTALASIRQRTRSPNGCYLQPRVGLNHTARTAVIQESTWASRRLERERARSVFAGRHTPVQSIEQRARPMLQGRNCASDEFAYLAPCRTPFGYVRTSNRKPIVRTEKGSCQMALCFRFLICFTLAVTSLQSSSIDAGSYVWSRTNGSGVSGNLFLKGNAKTLTFDACPSGTVAGNLVYISRGFGRAESAVIKSASCPPGKRGTVTIATHQVHLGKWTAATSTAGIQEAVAVLGPAGGEVLVGPGTFEMHSRITLTSSITLRGLGVDKTTLLVPRNEFKNSAPWQFGLYPSGTVIVGAPGHSAITVTGLSIKFSKQSSPPNGSYGIIFVDVTNSLIDAVAVRDGPILRKGNTFLPIGILGLSNNNTVQNSLVYNLTCRISSEGSGGFISGGRSNRFLHNYVSNSCNSAYVSGGFDILFQENMFELGDSTMVPNAQAYAADVLMVAVLTCRLGLFTWAVMVRVSVTPTATVRIVQVLLVGS